MTMERSGGRSSFAPHARSPSTPDESLQDYLQGHYIRAMQFIAHRVRGIGCVGAQHRRPVRKGSNAVAPFDKPDRELAQGRAVTA